MSSVPIIDLRPRTARLAARIWRRKPWPGIRLLERAMASLVHRHICHCVADRGKAPASPLRISIGNLALGGTGKTPLTIALAAELSGRGITTAILTRGYGSSVTDPVIVDPRRKALGDEARLMAEALPACPVIQAQRRWEGLRLMEALEPRPEVLIIEDGHQTRRVARHLDAVILEGTVDGSGLLRPSTGLTLPWGPWREDARGAERAAVWLVERDSDDAKDLEAGPGHVVIAFGRRLEPTDAIRRAATGPWGLFSGIGSPRRLEAAAADMLGCDPLRIVRFGDHHAYEARDVERLLGVGTEAGVRTWLTTAKDEIKLRDLWPPDVQLLALPLVVEWRGCKTLPDLVEERMRGG